MTAAEARARLGTLTPREREAATWAAFTYGNKEIARKLRVAQHSVSHLLGRARVKLHVRTRHDLARVMWLAWEGV